MLRPCRLEHVRGRLEQVVEPLRIRKPNLVHHRNHDGVLIVFLNIGQVAEILAGVKIKTAVFLDRMRDIALVANRRIGTAPAIAEQTLINSTCMRVIFRLRYITLPSDFFVTVERHLDLTHAVRHQVIHDKGIFFDKACRHDIGHAVAFHMTDGDSLRSWLAIRMQAVHAFPAVNFHAHLVPVRLRFKLERTIAEF